MRVSREEKDKSRDRIVASAAKLARERGLEGAAVNEVMREAGLTHGGFYRHFESKDALLEAGLMAAFSNEVLATLTADVAKGRGEEARRRYERAYLSREHVGRPGVGCPMAALGGDVARAPATLKAAFGAGVRDVVGALARTFSGRDAERTATRRLAMLVGAVVIARASDEKTARAVLEACRE